MRLFVAVPVPEGIREGVAGLGREIAGEGIVPVAAGNMHVTLKFLGEIDERKLGDIEQRLRGIGFAPFGCTVRGVGVFPDENYIRVVWAGIESGGKLESLAEEVIGALSGYGEDKRFSAHLTMARVKRKVDLKAFLETHRNDGFGAFQVSSFLLVQSELMPGGPKYTVVARFESRVQV